MLIPDLTPLFRSTIGFDHMAELLQSAARLTETAGYPPHDILKTGPDSYRIVMAVAGFAVGELMVDLREGMLTVSGRKPLSDEAKTVYLHRGIAERAFERRFQLADHVKVEKASLENGLLSIGLVREVPEALKPRRIAIATPAGGGPMPASKRIEGTATEAPGEAA